MELKRKFQGVIVANLTPFTTEGELDEVAYRNHIEFMIQKGVHGLFPIGTMGEGINLSVEKKRKIVDVLVDQVKDRIDLMIQATCNNTEESIEFAKYCWGKGVHALALITPWFYPYDDENLYENFGAIAKAVPQMPIFVYNNPGRSKNNISVKLYKRLYEDFDNIIGIKDSSQDMVLFQDYVAELSEDSLAIIGSDGLFYPALAVGGKGIVTAIANSHPEIFVALWDAFNAGDYKKACAIQSDINKMRTIFKIGPYVAAYKKAIEKRGIAFGVAKAPNRNLNEAELLKFEAAYENAAFIKKWEK